MGSQGGCSYGARSLCAHDPRVVGGACGDLTQVRAGQRTGHIGELLAVKVRNEGKEHGPSLDEHRTDALPGLRFLHRSICALDRLAGQVVLTPGEEETVSLVTEGLNNREIARELNLKQNTVKKSLIRIYDKGGVSNRVEPVLYAPSHSQARAA